MKLILFLLLHMLQTEPLHSSIRQIQQCGVHCSEGLHCKSRPSWSLSPCKKLQAQNNSTNIHNVTLSTVLRCEERKCFLSLNIAVMMTLYDDIRGVFMCVHSAGMLGHCQIVTFPHNARRHVTGKKVEVQYDCFSVRPREDVFVTFKTAPNFCHNVWTRQYIVPGCAHEDLRRKVTECISGELMYTVDSARREITVTVMEAPEDVDYNLRLCLKNRTCIGIEQHRLIKKQDVHRNESFQYSKALPCLCIEGWPATENTPRIQVCPFQNNMEELWSGVTFDHDTQTLSWKPMCPVKAVVSLCHAVGPKLCLDIRNVSLSSEKDSVMFSTVDPHPRLCMKFTTEAGFWIECPFSSERFPVWNLEVASKAGEHWVDITSWFPARFSVGLCKMFSTAVCEPTEENPFVVISVGSSVTRGYEVYKYSFDKEGVLTYQHFIFKDRTKPAAVNLSTSLCDTSICIQVRRIDVQFAVPEYQCNLQCFDQPFAQWSYSEALQKYAPPLVVCVIAFVMVALVIHVMLRVCDLGPRKQNLDKTPSCRTVAETETLIHTASEDMDIGLQIA